MKIQYTTAEHRTALLALHFFPVEKHPNPNRPSNSTPKTPLVTPLPLTLLPKPRSVQEAKAKFGWIADVANDLGGTGLDIQAGHQWICVCHLAIVVSNQHRDSWWCRYWDSKGESSGE